MKRALITTTINVPDVLRTWDRQLHPNDIIVVAGDKKTPATQVRLLLEQLGCRTAYVDTERTHWAVDPIIGYNVIQRRNLALLEALRLRPDVDYIITVDDDNYPASDWVSRVDDIFSGEGSPASPITTDTAWFNPGALCSPSVIHRGYPLSQYHTQPQSVIDNLTDLDQFRGHTDIGVFASLWTGAADVDAIHRIVKGHHVEAVWGDAVLEPGTWAPFNSQATAFRRELAPYLLMWPGVGRYDDIWASYLCRAVMDARGWRVRYGRPTVHQERNPHDDVRDMGDELIGYRYNETVIAALREITQRIESTMSVLAIMKIIEQALDGLFFLPATTISAWRTWQRDISTLIAEYDVNFEGVPR